MCGKDVKCGTLLVFLFFLGPTFCIRGCQCIIKEGNATQKYGNFFGCRVWAGIVLRRTSTDVIGISLPVPGGVFGSE
jgi:hypothetical protein